MKIFGIGRNFVKHIEELNNEKPEEPVIFTKPDTALLKNNAPFYYPEFSSDVHYEVEIIIRICREGKNVQEKFASKYFDKIGVGVDFTARDIQKKSKEKGLPWAIAKGFNNSAVISEFFPLSDFDDIYNLDFGLKIDGELKQKSNTKLMLFSFDYIVSYLSRFFTLKTGDIIFTGTPEGVGPVSIGNRLEGFIEDKILFNFEIR